VLKGKSTILDDTFRGLLLNQTISRECPHRSERHEPFAMISVTVKNKQNLAQAFDAYIDGDLLDGNNKYRCGECPAPNNKVAALKRAVLFTLPRYLIVHLKR
jgi:ubiquitin carboxyl-terminal hydrolase 34